MHYWLSLNFEPWENLLPLARVAEELGFEGVVLPDHILLPTGEATPHPTGYPLDPELPFVEPLIAFSAMAAVTSRLRFMTGVLVVPQRDPFLLAKQLGTLALMSGNRVVLGVGAGWLREEFEVLGQEFGNRGARLNEILQMLDDLWRHGHVSLEGNHYRVPPSAMFPFPGETIPVWLGAVSEAGRRRAARHQGYIPMRVYDDVSRAEFAEVDRLRSEAGLSGPFERVAFWPGGDRDTAQRMADDGVTSIVVQVWPECDPTPLERKQELARQFARTAF